MTMTVECSLACMQDACRVGYGEIISDASISDFRKLMLLELHQRKLLWPNPTRRHPTWAVLCCWICGNLLHWTCAHSQADSFIRFKFLHRVGAKSFDWPSRDDVGDVHISCVFYGPVTLDSAGPFAVPKQQNIEKKGLKKLKSKGSLIKMLHGWSVFRQIKQLWSFKKNMFSYSALFEFVVMQIWNFCLALALFHLLWINYRAQLVP